MREPCDACGKEIDPSHDAHYACPSCRKPLVLYCVGCRPAPERCPRCGSDLQHHEESITKKAFNNPATRGMLGF